MSLRVLLSRWHTTLLALLLSIGAFLASRSDAGELERIRVSPNGRGFVRAHSGDKFVVWGVNYDHDSQGRLLEDYWHEEWKTVEDDFREMRELGANLIRIHLQFGKFMEAADRPSEGSVKQLEKLLRLAEKEQLYLDITGLGCYHKADVPAWYDALDRQARWDAQTRFWEEIAARCAGSRAVFCYDLMNEPVVPGGREPRSDWLAGSFGGKHFVQYIALDREGRERPTMARLWIEQLAAAIRKHDREAMLTVGLVPWSLDRPGLQSGFIPEKIAEPLDFLAVHIYPETGKRKDALETLRGFAVGKPVLIEEFFPLRCGGGEAIEFLEEAREIAAGCVSFYWGTPAAELRLQKDLGAALQADWLDRFREYGPRFQR